MRSSLQKGNKVLAHLVQAFQVGRRQWLIWLSVWKIGVVPRIFGRSGRDQGETRAYILLSM